MLIQLCINLILIIFYSPTSGRATKLNTQSEKKKNNNLTNRRNIHWSN